jgi:hypothetical protein
MFAAIVLTGNHNIVDGIAGGVVVLSTCPWVGHGDAGTPLPSARHPAA